MKLNDSKSKIALGFIILPLLVIPFNPSITEHLLRLDITSGNSPRTIYIALFIAISLMTISRLIYKDKNTEKIIKISLTSYILNIFTLTTFVLASMLLVFRLGLEVNSDTGIYISLAILISLINTVFLETSLSEYKSKAKLSIQDIWREATKKPLYSLLSLYIAIIIILGTIAFIAPSLTIVAIWSISIFLWQILYCFFVQRALIPAII